MHIISQQNNPLGGVLNLDIMDIKDFLEVWRKSNQSLWVIKVKYAKNIFLIEVYLPTKENNWHIELEQAIV